MTTSRKIKVVVLLIALGVSFWLNNSKENQEMTEVKTSVNTNNANGFDYLPTSTTGVIISHNTYQLSYNEKHEQAEWVAYSLKKEDIVYSNHKRPFFIRDPKVKSKSADWRNYKKSGYDRGHLCPAGDRRFSKKAHDETFYTSNISPQEHKFNAGIWNKLEQKTRYWAKKYDHLYVVTGGVLKNNLNSIGKENVSIPEEFYKIILDYSAPEIKAIAFLMPHKESNKPLYEFVTSIDEIEKKTGIDFFPSLPDDIETRLEKSTQYKNWSFR
ncbi:endonuclease G [Tenacibaculum sp. MAR_2009_124]|uniref:DNA/RNA non-specific endonuclease n=1 Tax=Tenacibaculum sp. MAR_2009_124 TaxID=1250059 RepID=UPI0008945315|nr:DNA/RNA non-specific endonuclease [Tenacibaculum sp. MAR_2009_124]SEB95825.1 endonuclease G [Tenacibaculum sp. MAR_2009_124]